MRISLIFPTYNEAAVIATVLERFVEYCDSKHLEHELVVVNDGSTDETATNVKRVSETHPHVRLVEHPRNQGYGAALRSGFTAATGDFIFFTDGDGQFSPDDLDQTLALMDKNTIVLGYRQHRAEGFVRRMNAALWGGWIGLMLGFRVRDLNCAWKLFPRTLLVRTSLTSTGAFINAELLAAAHHQDLAFKEIPVRHFPRRAGNSTGANPGVIIRAFGELATFKRQARRPKASQSVSLPESNN